MFPAFVCDQRFSMNPVMANALAVLRMSHCEVAEWVRKEVENNPVLEVIEPDTAAPATPFDLSRITRKESPYVYLDREISLLFHDRKEAETARFIAGNLDRKGFLTLSDHEIGRLLNVDQTHLDRVKRQFSQIEPVGLGAKNPREALLIQLRTQNRGDSKTYEAVDRYFNDLLHNRFTLLARLLKCSPMEIKNLQRELRSLHPFPGYLFDEHFHTVTAVPDLLIAREEEGWSVETGERGLPRCRLHDYYEHRLRSSGTSGEERSCIRRYAMEGKRVMEMIERRQHLLLKLGRYLIRRQTGFLEGRLPFPAPLTRKEVAKALQVHSSTVARAVYGKYVSTPSGTFPLKQLFPQGTLTDVGSCEEAKELLRTFIRNEDKRNPLSDQILSEKLRSRGFSRARRTVAKYRRSMRISSTHRRKAST
ncbi:MAG: RNA polymerase factor sigma-54 [Simkaniaceae bacterium]|nr:RNA polymerase factor sigma-54 [Simkaniaceae bacterium]